MLLLRKCALTIRISVHNDPDLVRSQYFFQRFIPSEQITRIRNIWVTLPLSKPFSSVYRAALI